MLRTAVLESFSTPRPEKPGAGTGPEVHLAAGAFIEKPPAGPRPQRGESTAGASVSGREKRPAWVFHLSAAHCPKAAKDRGQSDAVPRVSLLGYRAGQKWLLWRRIKVRTIVRVLS